jgi:ABC-type Fe3+-hydroxamate transport system substrate-binding protein
VREKDEEDWNSLVYDGGLPMVRQEGATMDARLFHVTVLSTVLALSGGCARSAADSHQGKVVEAGNGKLTMTDAAGGNQHSHEIPPEVTITCAGRPCTLADLKPGAAVTVITEAKAGTPQVTKIEAQEGSSTEKPT